MCLTLCDASLTRHFPYNKKENSEPQYFRLHFHYYSYYLLVLCSEKIDRIDQNTVGMRSVTQA